jgi:hypothetical protein
MGVVNAQILTARSNLEDYNSLLQGNASNKLDEVYQALYNADTNCTLAYNNLYQGSQQANLSATQSVIFSDQGQAGAFPIMMTLACLHLGILRLLALFEKNYEHPTEANYASYLDKLQTWVRNYQTAISSMVTASKRWRQTQFSQDATSGVLYDQVTQKSYGFTIHWGTAADGTPAYTMTNDVKNFIVNQYVWQLMQSAILAFSFNHFIPGHEQAAPEMVPGLNEPLPYGPLGYHTIMSSYQPSAYPFNANVANPNEPVGKVTSINYWHAPNNDTNNDAIGAIQTMYADATGNVVGNTVNLEPSSFPMPESGCKQIVLSFGSNAAVSWILPMSQLMGIQVFDMAGNMSQLGMTMVRNKPGDPAVGLPSVTVDILPQYALASIQATCNAAAYTLTNSTIYSAMLFFQHESLL